MLKACVIGMGHIGNIHSWAYSNCPDAKLAGVCDIREIYYITGEITVREV